MSRHGFLVLALTGVLLFGCGGGSAPEVARLGSVALLLAEERSDAEPASVSATLTEVSLVPQGGGAPIVVFGNEGGQEIDLSREDLLISVADGIEPGRYGHVRVALAGVRLEGADCEDVEVDLPAGAITLVAEGAVIVAPGETLSVRIAIDIDKSMEHRNGVCTFRPVLKVRVGDDRRSSSGGGECPRTVTGTVEEVLDEGAGGVLSLGEHCDLDFLIGEDTAIFDEDGLLSDASEIVVGAELTVKGHLNDDDQLVALVIVVGQVIAVEGKVDSSFAEGTFVLLPDEDEEIVGALDVSVVDGTLILLDCGEGSTDDILLGSRLVATGKFDTASGALLAISVEIGPAELEGEITAIAESEGGFDITFQVDGEEGPRTLFVGEDVGIHLEGDGPIPSDLLGELLACGPVQATVFVAADDPTLVVEVGVEEAELEGEVTDIDASTRLMTVGDEVVGVLADATILDLRGEGGLIPFSDIEVGDRVRVFGLEACETQDVDFHGFVVLVVPEKKGHDDCDDEDDDDDDWDDDKHRRHGDGSDDDCDD